MTQMQFKEISKLIAKHKVSLSDIQPLQKGRKTKKEKSVCLFHLDMWNTSVVFDYDCQSEVFDVPVQEVKDRVAYARRRHNEGVFEMQDDSCR